MTDVIDRLVGAMNAHHLGAAVGHRLRLRPEEARDLIDAALTLTTKSRSGRVTGPALVTAANAWQPHGQRYYAPQPFGTTGTSMRRGCPGDDDAGV